MTGREAALAALERCRREKSWPGAVLDRMIREGQLTGLEAALATQLCMGVLQNQSYLDHAIRSFCVGKLQPKLADILRLGSYQILFLDKIPDHAAVNESVLLSKACGLSRASGLVNAVLRRISENKDELPEIPGVGSSSYLSVRYSHPEWLVKRLIEQNGYAFTEAFLSSNNEASPLTLQLNTLRCRKEAYCRALDRVGIVYSCPTFPDNAVQLSGKSPAELPGFEEGLFYVQDSAAAMAVEIAAPAPGMRVLDACAAPGGKSFAAAIRMKNEGAILSRDIHEKKLTLLQSGAARLGLTIIDTRAGDARKIDASMVGAFDLVMADVPCSGMGVIRKRPEIRYKAEADIAGLPPLQHDILTAVSACVKPGGTLLYSTCTVLKEENERVVEAFLSENPAFVPVDFPVADRSSQRGMYTFWPQIDGTDGFFVAKLKRAE